MILLHHNAVQCSPILDLYMYMNLQLFTYVFTFFFLSIVQNNRVTCGHFEFVCASYNCMYVCYNSIEIRSTNSVGVWDRGRHCYHV